MKTLFLNVNVLDGTKDMKPYLASVMVKDGIITDIISDAGLRDKLMDFVDCDDIIPLTGKYLMPGLINLHAHLPSAGKPVKASDKKKDTAKLASFLQSNALGRAIGVKVGAGSAKQALLSGTTTVRCVGGVGDFDTRLRDKINAGKVEGPRLLVANNAIATKGGHMAGTVAEAFDSIEACLKHIDKLKSQKVDLIKLMITGGVLDATVKGEPGIMKMPEEYIRACCDHAHQLGLKVAAHVESPAGTKAAVLGGVDTVEHGSMMDAEVIDAFLHHNSALVATFSPAFPIAQFDEKITGYNEMIRYNSNVVLEGVIEGAKTALASGIPLGLGTDAGCPYITHYDMWRELFLFSKYAGVTTRFALHTATLQNARIAGIDKETGSIEVGKSGDMIITDQNPLEDLTALRQPSIVVCRGKVYKNPQIKKDTLTESLLDRYYGIGY